MGTLSRVAEGVTSYSPFSLSFLDSVWAEQGALSILAFQDSGHFWADSSHVSSTYLSNAERRGRGYTRGCQGWPQSWAGASGSRLRPSWLPSLLLTGDCVVQVWVLRNIGNCRFLMLNLTLKTRPQAEKFQGGAMSHPGRKLPV